MYLSSNCLNAFKKYASKQLNFKESFLVRKYIYMRQNEVMKPFLLNRHFRTSTITCESKDKYALLHRPFFERETKNKETFLQAINKFRERERKLKGYLEFIQSSLKYLEEFGVHRELEVYKALMNLMPKGTMVPTNIIQEDFGHYAHHQYCALDLLEKMETHGVMPDIEFNNIIFNTFGRNLWPTLKLYRMMYWMPKFKNASPFPLPQFLPNDPLQLAVYALTQINCLDPASKVTVFESTREEVRDSLDDTWVVSSVSPHQRALVAQHAKDKPIKVEGPFGVFLQDERISYFILRAEAKERPPAPKRSEVDDVRSLFVWMSEEGEERDRDLIHRRTVHEQDDGVILATCATGTSSRDSLLSWIRILEQSIPDLTEIPVLFSLSSPVGDVIVSGAEEEREAGTAVESHTSHSPPPP